MLKKQTRTLLRLKITVDCAISNETVSISGCGGDSFTKAVQNFAENRHEYLLTGTYPDLSSRVITLYRSEAPTLRIWVKPEAGEVEAIR